MGDKKNSLHSLRLMTYLSPDLPIALFELVRDYLEEKIGVKAYLITESRWTGPPDDRPDPLTSNDADIVFLSSRAFQEQQKKKNKFMELCKAVPLHSSSNSPDEPVCFSEVVVLTSKVTQHIYKDFEALRGSRWACTDKDSVAGSKAMLAELKRHGFNANFFSSTCQSGSYLRSIQMLLNGQVDVASIDSLVLAAFRLEHPREAEQLTVLKSIGPLPMYSIVFNSRLPGELKEKILEDLLTLTKDGKWAGQFMTWGVKGFVPISEDHFSLGVEMVDSVKNMSIAPAYY